MKPELEVDISNLPDASFKSFRLYQPAFESHWHYHPELELVFFSKGKGMRFIGDDISLYSEGDLFLIGQNLPHTFVSYAEDSLAMVEAFCIQFPSSIFESFVECKSLMTLFQEAKRGIWYTKPDEIVVEKLKNVVQSTGIQSLVLLMELLEFLHKTTNCQQILSHDYQRHALVPEGSTRIRVAIDYINAHYQHKIALKEIAHVCHFSPNAFCRWFKQNMGLTYVDYLNKVRLTHICQLLIATDLPINYLAAQTGFDNISTLNRLFKQKLNTSPSGYRSGEKHQHTQSALFNNPHIFFKNN